MTASGKINLSGIRLFLTIPRLALGFIFLAAGAGKLSERGFLL
jgi:hypothetical protein